jgi:molybdopterin synthase catalytic subunit
MDIQKMISKLMEHEDSRKMGMIASHLGIVRETSRAGDYIDDIEVTYDSDKLEEIIREIKELPGIVDVAVETASGRLQIGDPVMAVVVGGDIREHVFPALIKTVERIKGEACVKNESIR